MQGLRPYAQVAGGGARSQGSAAFAEATARHGRSGVGEERSTRSAGACAACRPALRDLFNHPASRDSFDRSAYAELVQVAGAGDQGSGVRDRSPGSLILASAFFLLTPYTLHAIPSTNLSNLTNLTNQSRSVLGPMLHALCSTLVSPSPLHPVP
jgi:hypothetical protein